MDIKRKITEAQGLTPTEQQLGIAALAIGQDIRGLSIKEFAARTNVSVASVHRFAKARSRRLQGSQGRAYSLGNRGGKPPRRGHQLSL